MLSRLCSVAFLGLDAVPVDVEVDAQRAEEKTTLILVGLPDAAVRESKDRVIAAIRNAELHIGQVLGTINLAPGTLKKEGPLYDLPIALGLLRSMGLISTSEISDYLIVGELGLSGMLRPIRGALSIAMLAKKLGKKGVLLPGVNANEAAAVPDINIYPINHLKEAVCFFNHPGSIPAIKTDLKKGIFKHKIPPVDFSDIKGQEHVKRAMEIAAAGGHNVVLSGPPGSGKTMIAKALIGILPQLTVDEALEITKIHSIAGIIPDGESVITQRPFRSPHHTVSYAGLIGGGTVPRPGEVSLAHHGVLFLDELPEFSRMVLEVLRQPLEDRHVTISRANGNFTFPTNIMCISAMNPCPCGMLGHPDKACSDTQAQVDRYRGKISQPLWDRMDMHIEVPAQRYRELMQAPPGESSNVVRQRVETARRWQHRRFDRAKTNAQMSASEMKKHVPLSTECQEVMRQAIDIMGYSARACDRLKRVARTIADLEEKETVTRDHLMEALNFRS